MRLIVALTCATLLTSTTCPVEAEELSGTLKKIKERGAISLGFRDSSVPFSYLDNQQKPVGMAMDFCLAIADAVREKLNDKSIKVDLLAVAPASRIALLTNGTTDLDCGANTNNPERQKVLGFTNTIFLTASKYVSKKNKNLHTVEDLRGRTIVSTSGSSNMRQIVQLNAQRKLGLTILTAKDHAEGFLLVENGRADAFVMDDILLASFIAASKDPSAYEISSEGMSKAEPYSIMLRKDDAPFKALADEAVASILTSPRMAALYDKWFTKPIPPHGINLNFPMSAQMKQAFAHPTDSPDPDAY